jgi:hypothetical protein
MEVSVYLNAFGRFDLAKDLLVLIGWEVGDLLIWPGRNGRKKMCYLLIRVLNLE